MSCTVVFWRSVSRRITSAMSGSVARSASNSVDTSVTRLLCPSFAVGLSEQPSGRSLLAFDLVDLVHAALVAPTLELGGQPHAEDLVGQPLAHDAGADGQHVGVV